MKTKDELFEGARNAVGSHEKVIEEIGVSESTYWHMKRGSAVLSPYVAARLAELCGDDPKETALAALAANKHNRVHAGEWKRWGVSAIGAAILAAGSWSLLAFDSSTYEVLDKSPFIHYANS